MAHSKRLLARHRRHGTDPGRRWAASQPRAQRASPARSAASSSASSPTCVGNPFIQQIIERRAAGRRRAGRRPPGRRARRAASPDEQIALIQGFADAGVEGIATSVPGATLAEPLNAIIDRASRSSSSTCSTRASRPLCRRALRRERPHPGGQGRSSCWVARARPARSSSATACPATRCSRTAPKGVRESLAEGAGPRASLADFDVKVAADRELRGVGSHLTANPDAVAPSSACARPTSPSLGQAPGSQPGHRLRRRRLRPDGREPGRHQGRHRRRQPRPDPLHAGLSAGQDAASISITGETTADLAAGGFIERGHGDRDRGQRDRALRPAGPHLRRARGIAADPAAARAYYQPLVDGIIANWTDEPRAHRERVQVALMSRGRQARCRLTARLPPDAPPAALRRPRTPRGRRPRPVQVVRGHQGAHRHGPRGRAPAPSTRSSARTAPASPR